MKLGKVVKLFKDTNKSKKSIVDSMIAEAKEQGIDLPPEEGVSYITKASAKEAKENFLYELDTKYNIELGEIAFYSDIAKLTGKKSTGKDKFLDKYYDALAHIAEPDELIVLAALDDIILGNVKGIKPTKEVLNDKIIKNSNLSSDDLTTYPLRFTGDEVDREMFQRKFIPSYDALLNSMDEIDGLYSLEAKTKDAIKKNKGSQFQLSDELKSANLDFLNYIKDRTPFVEGGEATASQMNKLMGTQEIIPDPISESELVPDEEMEEDYVDFVVNQALNPQEKEYLETELESNDTLSMLFDKVVEVASEFSGEGPVDGPGTGVSDSIPARLSDGEFVFTAKAVQAIGVEKLEQLMEAAEVDYDKRMTAYNGGVIETEDETVELPAQEQTVKQDIRIRKETVGKQATMQEEDELIADEIKKRMLDPNQNHVRS
jgi:hypothetical protein